MSGPLYLDPSASVDARVEDLLQRMTLEEKVAQLGSTRVDELLVDRKFSEERAGGVLKNGIGEITRVSGSRLGLKPREAASLANEVQRYLVTKTRLKIPAIIHEECLSGFMATTATSFPQYIGLASTWDPDLMHRIATAIREQMRRVGVHQGLAPVLDVARDPRYGRTEETLGEDPCLVGALGVAYIKGLQGGDLRSGIVATIKHFAAHAFPEGGRNTAPVHVGPRTLRETFMYPFEAAVKIGGAYSLMPAYHEIDGVPCHANKWLLTEVLRKEWGFKGIIVSDYGGIERLARVDGVARDSKEAAALSLEAGIDVELPTMKCYRELLVALKEGLVEESVIDEAVRRVLRLKLLLGLFENPFVDIKSVPEELDNPEHRALALEAARKSIVLLKNDGVLPLKKDVGSIAVIGPNAASARNLLGDYTYTAHLATSGEAVRVTTILEGIKSKVSAGTMVHYAKGSDIAVTSDDFDRAIEIARNADVVVLVVGEKSGLSNRWVGRTFEELQHLTGEGNDSNDLKLPRVQEELVLRITGLKKPVVLVLVNGRPLDLSGIVERVSAVVEAWLPGEEGGTAVADVLFGDHNPGGRLPISWPKNVGQLPVYYNRKPSSLGEYVFTDSKPLFPFGYGLSYTKFKYDSLEISPSEATPTGGVKISFSLENTGERDGDEVAQLYISKEHSSVARPVKELKGFKAIHLKPGERKKVTFTLPAELLAFYDKDMKLVVEPGVYKVSIGGSSEDTRLAGEFRVAGKRELQQRTTFFSEVTVG